MTLDQNPFVFEAANNLSDEMILDYYIDDHNYSRFLQSSRNIFLVGERGSGKTMALLFNSWRVQNLRAEKQGEASPLSSIGVYVPCNTPLTHKTEYQLLDNRLASAISEHFFVLSITLEFVNTLRTIEEVCESSGGEDIRDEVGFILGDELPLGTTVFDSVKKFIRRELSETQRTLNSEDPEAFYQNTFTFSSLFVPLLHTFSEHIAILEKSHFRLMIDDAHSLNEYQIRSLNSWIAYRDHSRFSFKVAVANFGRKTKITTTGGSILDGHDYTTVDLGASFLNKDSQFYRLAHTVVKRRLQNASIHVEPEQFFPMSPVMRKELDKLALDVRAEAVAIYGDTDDVKGKISNYVYKYTRARYFQKRSASANRPSYSGFETLVFLSTGVLRNLLEPCFRMFDQVISQSNVSFQSTHGVQITKIPPAVQNAEILKISDDKWDWTKSDLADDIDDCTSKDAEAAYRLLDALANHFRHRLATHRTEPCALSFTISARNADAGHSQKLRHLIEILRKAQLIYIRSGSAKQVGQREDYYVPNRILWPSRGLDPQGQHARVSLPESVLWRAAETGVISLIGSDDERQGGLFT